MRNEIDPTVFAYVDDIRSRTPSRSKTEVLKLAGVRDAEDKRSEWAWELAGGGYLLSIWCEGVRVHAGTGSWYYVDTLDTEHRRSGAPLGPLQAPRARFRIDCLKRLHSAKMDFLAVLQVNRISEAQLELGADSEVDFRVKDGERWHVAICDDEKNLLVLVRGKAGWIPSSEDLDAASSQKDRPALGGEPKLVFPDQAHRDLVEAAAMEHATKEYTRRGLRVEDVSSQNRGYDLEVFDQGGRAVYHVEVKGTSLPVEGFYLTRNERKCSASLNTWRLVVVTSALTEPDLQVYTAKEMEERFAFEPLVWRCDPAS